MVTTKKSSTLLVLLLAGLLSLFIISAAFAQLIGGGGTANPAAVKCTQAGYDYENGECVFPDGSSCDAWDFYSGKCGYSPAPEPTPVPTPQPAPEPVPTPQPSPEPEPFVGPVIGGKGTANPAAVKCDDAGYDYENGECVFPDGSSCDAWDFYSGKCDYNPKPTPEPIIGPGGENPASVYCVQQGGTVKIEQSEGGEVGICVFPDGSSCEEWAYYRGECTPKPPVPVGQGGTRQFTFRAVAPGETDLVLLLKGPDGSVQQRKPFHIVVVN